VWKHTQLVIDVVPGRSAGFSLEAPEGKRFLTRGRAFSPAELCCWTPIRRCAAPTTSTESGAGEPGPTGGGRRGRRRVPGATGQRLDALAQGFRAQRLLS